MLNVLLTSKGPHFEFICVTIPGLQPHSRRVWLYRPVSQTPLLRLTALTWLNIEYLQTCSYAIIMNMPAVQFVDTLQVRYTNSYIKRIHARIR